MSRVPASPHFFEPVGRAFVAALVCLALLALAFPAPLEIAADSSSAPNPAKSAWFLLWIQELVSFHTYVIYIPLAVALLLVSLPWLPVRAIEHASWFQKEHRVVWVVAMLLTASVVALTVVAMFFRGKDWCLVSPF